MLGKTTKAPKAEKASKEPKVQLTKEEKALQKAATAAKKQAEKILIGNDIRLAFLVCFC